MRYHHFRLSTNVLCLLALTQLGCTFGEPAADQAKKRAAVPVKVVSVTETPLERITTQPATIYPYYQAKIRAKVSGYVRELQADIGDVVHQGDVLAVIDVPEMEKQRRVIEARIGRLEAEEKRAAAEVKLAEANVRTAEAKRAQAQAELNRAAASLAASEAEFSRTQDLVERQSLQQRLLDEARKKRDSERANQKVAESGIDAAEAGVVVARARQSALEADLAAAKAETIIARRELEELDVLIAYTQLKAPFDGIITQRNVEPGDLVRKDSEASDGKPLFVVSRIDKVRVRIPVPEADAAFVSQGDQVKLTFPFFPAEQAVTGAVTRMAGSLDASTRTMLVEADVDNDNYKLIPGMFGEATINLSTRLSAHMLPARAIRFREEGGAYVYAVGDDDTVSIVDVSTGADDGAVIEIVSGLNAGQRVIDAHLKRFVDGQKVEVLND
jgi:HlyD family secretion protein